MFQPDSSYAEVTQRVKKPLDCTKYWKAPRAVGPRLQQIYLISYHHYCFVVNILSHHMVRLTRRHCLNVSLWVPDLTKHDVTQQVGPKTLRFCVTWHWIQLTANIEILKFRQTTCKKKERSSHRVCPYNKRHYLTCNSNAASLKFKLSARPKIDRNQQNGNYGINYSTPKYCRDDWGKGGDEKSRVKTCHEYREGFSILLNAKKEPREYYWLFFITQSMF